MTVEQPTYVRNSVSPDPCGDTVRLWRHEVRAVNPTSWITRYPLYAILASFRLSSCVFLPKPSARNVGLRFLCVADVRLPRQLPGRRLSSTAVADRVARAWSSSSFMRLSGRLSPRVCELPAPLVSPRLASPPRLTCDRPRRRFRLICSPSTVAMGRRPRPRTVFPLPMSSSIELLDAASSRIA